MLIPYDIKNWLNNWILTRSSHNKNEEILDSVYDNSGIDSFSIIEFINDIEHEFMIQFNEDDFKSESFSSIDGLVGIITHKINSK